jgi:hypothetical protein
MAIETEITNTDEALETEVLEQVDTELETTDDAETQKPETPAEETEVAQAAKVETVPVHVVAEQRERAREAELKAARLEGELNAYKQKEVAQVAVAQKSPMQIAAEQQGIDTTQPGWKKEVVMDGEIYEQQAAWDKNQTAQTVKVESIAAAASQYPDFKQVIAQGEDHLTIAERRMIDKSVGDYGQKAYELCQKALKRAGLENPTAETPAPTTKVPVVQSTTKKAVVPIIPKTPEPPTQDEILSGISPSVQRAMNF